VEGEEAGSVALAFVEEDLYVHYVEMKIVMGSAQQTIQKRARCSVVESSKLHLEPAMSERIGPTGGN